MNGMWRADSEQQRRDEVTGPRLYSPRHAAPPRLLWPWLAAVRRLYAVLTPGRRMAGTYGRGERLRIRRRQPGPFRAPRDDQRRGPAAGDLAAAAHSPARSPAGPPDDPM